jgi:hypothetical protein
MKRINWLKILGVAILIHVILIALSFIEVFIYSTLINPGQTKEFYEGHATKTAPYVATIAGFILMYLFVVRLNRKKETNPFLIGFALPIIYIIIDFILLASTTPDWTKQLNIPLISNFIKLLAGIIAAYRIKQSKTVKYAK